MDQLTAAKSLIFAITRLSPYATKTLQDFLMQDSGLSPDESFIRRWNARSARRTGGLLPYLVPVDIRMSERPAFGRRCGKQRRAYG